MSRKNNDAVELAIADAIDKKKMLDQILPVVESAMKYGGGADTIIQKSQAAAATAMVMALFSSKDETRLRAAEKILDRALGRPVERRLDIYANISEMSEKDLDAQIKKLVADIGPSAVIDAAIAELPALEAARKQRKKVKAILNKSKDPNPV